MISFYKISSLNCIMFQIFLKLTYFIVGYIDVFLYIKCWWVCIEKTNNQHGIATNNFPVPNHTRHSTHLGPTQTVFMLRSAIFVMSSEISLFCSFYVLINPEQK